MIPKTVWTTNVFSSGKYSLKENSLKGPLRPAPALQWRGADQPATTRFYTYLGYMGAEIIILK